MVMRKTCVIGWCWMVWALSALTQQPATQSPPGAASVPENNPYATAADVEAGRRLYLGRCGPCHGLSGEGGRGAVLNSGQFQRADSDGDLFLIVRNGIPGSEMPGTQSPEMEVWRVVAYVRQLSRRGSPEPVTGDPAAGALVYNRHGCTGCHTIDGQGGVLGPDLTGLGARRSVRYVRESIVDPNADIPLDHRSVRVITATGASVTGIHLNEDEYSIHLRDTGGVPRSFLKSELKEITLTGKSLMPPYPSLSKDDLENLVAYLSSLRTRR
jgi:putative heme-binding domain-containing protein